MSLENKYFAELARRLRAAGITAGHPEKNRLTVLLNNQPVLSVSAGSDVFLLPAGISRKPVNYTIKLPRLQMKCMPMLKRSRPPPSFMPAV